MALRLEKPWLPLAPDEVERAPGHLGVYEIATSSGEVVYVGFAGGRSLFGLRGALREELERREPGAQFRYEVNAQYSSRYRELLMVHRADRGQLPRDNAANPPPRLGRLSPA